MNFKIHIPKIDWKFDVSKLYILEKSWIVTVLFTISMLLLYLGSLHPWFFWPMKDYYKVFAGAILFFALVIDNSAPKLTLDKKGIFFPMLVFSVLTYLLLFVNAYGPGSYIVELFTIIGMLGILKANNDLLVKSLDFIARFMAILLAVSIFFFVLYLMGFPLPYRSSVFGDGQYSFSNYLFFMIDERFLWSIIPRFGSVFLEPGHLGGATSLLLMTQFGKWKRWYNVILIITTLITFSLAAYAFFVALIFFNMWVQRKNVIGKFLLIVIILALSVVASFYYNDGDNLVHQLIVLRLEINDDTGEIEGNNRVSEAFEKEFDSYMMSADVLTGRDFSKVNDNDEHGNSGYRVYIYENGIIATILVLIFYILCFKDYTDYRYLITGVILSLMVFWVRGYPLWYSNFIPLLATVHMNWNEQKEKLKPARIST